MTSATPRRQLILLLSLLLALASCDAASTAAPTPATAPTRLVPTLFPTAPLAPTPIRAPASQAQPADTGWQAGPNGVELRRLRVAQPDNRPAIPVTIVRTDPAATRVRVAYAPARPLSLRQWFAAAHPLVAINGGFFHDDNSTAALLVSDGVASGASYEGFGGMLTVAPGGAIGIQALRDQPYSSDEPLEQALQSFPMLVFPGGQAAQPEDNGERARRSAIAIDTTGRLLLIACPTNGFTLSGLADWLSHSDLAIDRALNLDGGSSTGLFAADGNLRESIDSFGALPIVVLVEAK